MLSEAGLSMSVYDPFYFANAEALRREYDVVTCSEVVEHFRSPQSEWARLASLVRPGGLLAVMTHFSVDGRFAGWQVGL